MNILQADRRMADAIAPLVADLRVVLASFKGIDAKPDPASGKEEILGFLDGGWVDLISPSVKRSISPDGNARGFHRANGAISLL